MRNRHWKLGRFTVLVFHHLKGQTRLGVFTDLSYRVRYIGVHFFRSRLEVLWEAR